MTASAKLQRYGNIALRISIPGIILLGIIMRLVLLFQNRNLIIDEANIVRNLAERDFAGLARPLNYEQYAPPVFLWIEKLSSLLFGYGEKAMRLYPLLCGIGSLFIFHKVAAKIMRRTATWLPFALFSFGIIYVEYAVTLKQYMPDAFIALLLIWLALQWDTRTKRKARFMLCWIIAGSVAIWSSMPSVFILTGIGGYYLWDALREKRYRDVALLCAISAVWLGQFALYYLAILKPQIGSGYLQSYHHDYFLNPLPASYEEWRHNWRRFEEIIGNAGGWSTVAVVFHIILLITGALVLLRKHTARFFLIALPVGLVFAAAAFNQFSLIARVVLFMMPLWLLIIGVGFDTAWRLPLRVKYFLIVVGLLDIAYYNSFKYFWQKRGFHEITEGMDYIRSKGGHGNQVYVHDANTATYLYYTELHPGKAKWCPLYGAHLLRWDSDYTAFTRGLKDTVYFLYTGGFSADERARRTKEIEANMRQIDYFEKYICYVYVYVPKAP